MGNWKRGLRLAAPLLILPLGFLAYRPLNQWVILPGWGAGAGDGRGGESEGAGVLRQRFHPADGAAAGGGGAGVRGGQPAPAREDTYEVAVHGGVCGVDRAAGGGVRAGRSCGGRRSAAAFTRSRKVPKKRAAATSTMVGPAATALK